MSKNKGIAVITGASSGIGAVYADRLAAQGYDLVLVARRLGKLIELADNIREKSGRKVELLPADLTDATDLARVETRLKTDKAITMLVNNAGFGGYGTVSETSADQMSSMIALNVNALMRLTYAIVPVFIAKKSGAIINIASVVAIQPELLNGVYGGTKAFVLGFSQSLRQELQDKGVTVQVVLPGATATEFLGAMGEPAQKLPGEFIMTSEDMVDAALKGFEAGEFVTIPPLQDEGLWRDYENARQAMTGKLSTRLPAPRYRG
jgi:short-subunit dehydrogenase